MISIEAIDDSLRMIHTSYGAWSRRYTARFFDGFERSQATRTPVRARLAPYGATAAIDAVLLNALRGAGVVDADLLRTLHHSRDNATQIVGADGTCFKLHWVDGYVTGWVHLGDGVTWNAGNFFFDRAPQRFGERDIGRRLVDIYPHPLLEDCTFVRSARGRKGRSAQLTCSMANYAFHLEEERFI